MSRCQQILNQYRQPALVETYLSGREFTVAVFGYGKNSQAPGVMEIIFSEHAEKNAYSFLNKEFYEGKVSYRIANDEEAQQAGMTAVSAYQKLRCRDAARIDIRSNDKGLPHFIEANPIPGLHPKRSDLIILMGFLGFRFENCIERILSSALQRNGLQLLDTSLCA